MTILAFISDLFFISRVDAAAKTLGIEVAYIESAADLPARSGSTDPIRPGEALEGREGALVRRIAEDRPGLLLFDLDAAGIPWRQWIALLKSSAATRRVPVLAYGSHMDVDTMKAAREAGADQVLARSRFTADLPELIRKYHRGLDLPAILEACEAPLSDLAWEGIELFNKGEYYEAHEVLEEAWNDDASPARELYRAILQVAVAYLQIERDNYRGAVKMFLRVRQWIDPLPAVCRGVDVAALRTAALRVEREVLRLGENRLQELDRRLFKPVVVSADRS